MIVILKDNTSLLSLTMANSDVPETLDHTFSNRCWLKVPVSNTVMYRLFQNAKCKEGKLSLCPDSPIKDTLSTGIMTSEKCLSLNMSTAHESSSQGVCCAWTHKYDFIHVIDFHVSIHILD